MREHGYNPEIRALRETAKERILKGAAALVVFGKLMELAIAA